MTHVGTRIKEARNAAKLSQSGLATQCGWQEMQTRISSYENNRTEPSYADLEKIARVLGVNPAWLAFGSNAVPQIRERPSWLADAEDTGPDGRYDAESDNHIALPYLNEADPTDPSSPAAVVEDLSGPRLRFNRITLRQADVPAESAVAARLVGNAMEPSLPHGSLVGIDTSQLQVTDGQLYAFDHGGILKVRVAYRLPGGLRLKAYNESEHPEEHLTGEDLKGIKILGRVFWYSVLL